MFSVLRFVLATLCEIFTVLYQFNSLPEVRIRLFLVPGQPYRCYQETSVCYGSPQRRS
jgi:hypothetical protein